MSPEIGTVQTDVTVAGSAKQRRTGRWIDDWRPEDLDFWEATGNKVAKRNLIWSIFVPIASGTGESPRTA